MLLDAKADASALADISNTSPLHMLLRCERLTQGSFFPAVFFFFSETVSLPSRAWRWHLTEPLYKLKDVIEGMLQNGASINGLNTYGETALHCTRPSPMTSCRNGSSLPWLMQCGVVVACWKGNARAVSILLKNGAHVHAVNRCVVAA